MRLLKEDAPWLDYIVSIDDEGKRVFSDDTPEEYKKMYEAHKKKVRDFRRNGYTNGRKKYEERKRREREEGVK